MKLSVVMPVYNERRTLRAVIERVLAVPLDLELICVDDGSRDGSREILTELQNQHSNLRVFLQPKNMGKGAALRRGIEEATGDFVIIQDADLEYDPADYPEPARSADSGKGRRCLRFTFSGQPPASRSLLLAFGRQPLADLAFELPHQHQPERHGNLLQSLPSRNYPGDSDRGEPLWL